MAVAISKPLVRSDDVRALRFRHRRLVFSGNYATNGETVLARSVGLNRIYAVIPADSLIRDPAGVTGVLPIITIAANRQSFTIKSLEDAAGAAGTPIGAEKTNAEAYIANSAIDLIILGE